MENGGQILRLWRNRNAFRLAGTSGPALALMKPDRRLIFFFVSWGTEQRRKAEEIGFQVHSIIYLTISNIYGKVGYLERVFNVRESVRLKVSSTTCILQNYVEVDDILRSWPFKDSRPQM